MVFPKNLHHAYVLEGNVEVARSALFEFLKSEYGIRPGHADLFILTADTFNVEDAKNLNETNLRRPVYGSKFIMAEFSGMTVPAQNSLLKTLEEPGSNTYIFLITSSAAIFLPTIMSRVHGLSFAGADLKDTEGKLHKGIRSGETFDAKSLAAKFLAANPGERIEIVKKLMAEKERETIGDAEIFMFAEEIEITAHAQVKDKKKLKPLLIANEYMRDTSSSKKMLLEYLAVTLP